MSDFLRWAEFTLDMIELDEVQAFTCGTQSWQLQVSDWIKGKPVGKSVRESMLNRNTSVWIYFNSNDDFVGFGSLGPSQWKYPGPRDKMLLSCIPMLGVGSQFHRRGYGRQILRDLRRKAESQKTDRPLLGLWVHPENTAAIALYHGDGFTELDRRDGMIRMALRL